MVKKRNSTTAPAPKASQEKQATLQDLLSRDIIDKLKAQANEMKAEEAKQKEEARQRAAETQKAEQKRLDNDFEHLLNNSKMDWKQFKK